MLTMKGVGRQLQQLQLRLLPYFHAAQKREIQWLLAFTVVVMAIYSKQQETEVMSV